MGNNNYVSSQTDHENRNNSRISELRCLVDEQWEKKGSDPLKINEMLREIDTLESGTDHNDSLTYSDF